MGEARTTRRVRATQEGLAAATGATAPSVQQRLVLQALDALWVPPELTEAQQAEQLEAAYALLQELQPRDAAEGMLAAQMLAVHGAAMDCLRRAAAPGAGAAAREAALCHAMRLMALFPRQLEAMDRRHGANHQRMTVEHVLLSAEQREVLAEAGVPVRRRHRMGALAHEPMVVVHGDFDFSTPAPEPLGVEA